MFTYHRTLGLKIIPVTSRSVWRYGENVTELRLQQVTVEKEHELTDTASHGISKIVQLRTSYNYLSVACVTQIAS